MKDKELLELLKKHLKNRYHNNGVLLGNVYMEFYRLGVSHGKKTVAKEQIPTLTNVYEKNLKEITKGLNLEQRFEATPCTDKRCECKTEYSSGDAHWAEEPKKIKHKTNQTNDDWTVI